MLLGLLIAVSVALLLCQSHAFTDARIAGQLRQVHAQMSLYLSAHDYSWPTAATPSTPASPLPWWCPASLTRESSGFHVASFDSTPNIAFRYPRKPWVTYPDKPGRKHHIFPDGSIEIEP